MSECLITIGCVFAMASEEESGEIISRVEGDPVLAFCFTSETDQKLISTSQGLEFVKMGFLPIGVAQIDLNDPSEFLLRELKGLSAALRFALHHKASDLVRNALGGLLEGQNQRPGRYQ
jgi:hypothetical protein